MKKALLSFISVIMSFILSITLIIPACAETSTDFESLFQEMDIETLEETSVLLLKILNEKKVANAKLIMEPSENILAVGKNLKLEVSSDGREVTAKTQVTFESSDESVAAVKNGTVTGKAPGTATVTATAVFEDGAMLQATSTITVFIPVSSLKANSREANVLAGNELDIASLITIAPDDATEKGLLFTVDDESVASISEDGKLAGLKAGKVNVLVTSAEKTDSPKTASIIVNVNQATTGITLNVEKFDVGNGNTYKLQATISPENATDQSVTWESKDPAIATVSRDGTVTGAGTGTTSIVCTANDGSGVSASAEVTVITAVKRLSLDIRELIVTKEKTANINVTITPANPTNGTLNWVSSDDSIAKVSSEGLVTAVGEGECTITASTTDGTDISVSVPVYVEPRNPVVIESISWRTSWGRRTGQMAVYATNKCRKRIIKAFDYTVFCVKGKEYIGDIPIRNGWTTDLTFKKQIRPGQELEGPMEQVSGFGAVSDVEITPIRVYFTDGTVEDIPSDAQYTSNFTVY